MCGSAESGKVSNKFTFETQTHTYIKPHKYAASSLGVEMWGKVKWSAQKNA